MVYVITVALPMEKVCNFSCRNKEDNITTTKTGAKRTFLAKKKWENGGKGNEKRKIKLNPNRDWDPIYFDTVLHLTQRASSSVFHKGYNLFRSYSHPVQASVVPTSKT